ncbi:hypothetical protein EV2_018850 [Malus domestica]
METTLRRVVTRYWERMSDGPRSLKTTSSTSTPTPATTSGCSSSRSGGAHVVVHPVYLAAVLEYLATEVNKWFRPEKLRGFQPKSSTKT